MIKDFLNLYKKKNDSCYYVEVSRVTLISIKLMGVSSVEICKSIKLTALHILIISYAFCFFFFLWFQLRWILSKEIMSQWNGPLSLTTLLKDLSPTASNGLRAWKRLLCFSVDTKVLSTP